MSSGDKQVKKRTQEEFKEQAKIHNIDEWLMHDCSMCQYQCGFMFLDDGSVRYDNGCYCAYNSRARLSNWQEVANHYNLQSNKDVIAEYDKFWHFNPN